MFQIKSLNIFLSFFIGAASTFYLAPYSDTVIGASIVGLLGSFIPNKAMQAAAYSGAFAGMSASFIIGDFYDLLIASVAGAAILLLLEKKFIGYGGKLGASAFLSILILKLMKDTL